MKVGKTPQKCVLFVKLMVFLGVVGTVIFCRKAGADDWPTYRYDNARSGAGTETVSPPLYLQWVFEPGHTPQPAWPVPAEEMPRTHGDNAFHVTVADGMAYFGSSVTNKVHAIDAAEGRIRWIFYTQGPVRFAPTIYEEKVYFGSDDGYVYCLSAKSGELLWKYRPGPSEEKVLGSGRMISIWPIRSSVLVDEDEVFCSAGVFPFEGLYICCLRAEDGSVIWKNDTVGDHPHELEFGGISPQNYLVASKEILYVPSGRAMPAAFDRKTGKLLFYASPGAKRGGTWALLDENNLIAGVDLSGVPEKSAYDAKTGRRRGTIYAWYPGLDMVVTPEFSYTLTGEGIYGINRAVFAEAEKISRTATGQRNKLREQVTELRKKRTAAEAKERAEIDKQIQQLAQQLLQFDKDIAEARASSHQWRYSNNKLFTLIRAGEVIYAGGDGIVAAVEARTGKELWQTQVEGKAVGLAAAGGKLFVSSDKGPIYCFGKDKVVAKEIKFPLRANPYPQDNLTKTYEFSAETILRESGITKGYCVVVENNIGRLAYELAKRTELKIIGLEKDPDKLKIARSRLEAAGMLGSRVVVEPWDIEDLPPYFANLVVSDEMVLSGWKKNIRERINHILRPAGGMIVMCGTQSRRGWIWDKFVRGELEGAGSWEGLYANAANTACSEDDLVKGPFGLLWYGEPGPLGMLDRHSRAMGPVSIDGRLFIQGEEFITACDAYNGTILWKREIPGAVRARADVDGGNLALTEDGLYVAALDKCYRLEPATGEIVRTYELPASKDGSQRRWGYIACNNGILYGVAAAPLKQEYAAEYKKLTPDVTVSRTYQRDGTNWRGMADYPSWSSQRSARNALTERLMGGDVVFALDAKTSKELWVHQGRDIPNISVTMGEGVLYLVERAAEEDQRTTALKEKRQLIDKGIYQEGAEAKLTPAQADVRLVTALDAVSGKVRWSKPLDVTGCGGDKMGSAYKDGKLLFFGHFSNHDTGFFLGGELTWRRITVLDAATGAVAWSRPLDYLRRPLIMGDKIIIEPRACELHTGEIVMRSHPISGQDVEWEFLRPDHCCSITGASAHTMFYRSGWTAIYEVTGDKGLNYFGGIRPGCWLNAISANGLMLMPEASSGCTCAFPLRCSLALVHKPQKVTGNWTVFITHGPMTPVKHLAVNLGAPGDMKDEEGMVWFAYPRPNVHSAIGYGSYGVKFDINDEVAEGGGYFCRDYKGVDISETDRPWLFTSGCQGQFRCELPLIDEAAGEKEGIYTVRLGFAAPAGDRAEVRVFEVKIQGRAVLSNFDIAKQGGGFQKALVKQFKGIKVRSNLDVELVSPNGGSAAAGPLINFIEVQREDVENLPTSARKTGGK